MCLQWSLIREDQAPVFSLFLAASDKCQDAADNDGKHKNKNQSSVH